MKRKALDSNKDGAVESQATSCESSVLEADLCGNRGTFSKRPVQNDDTCSEVLPDFDDSFFDDFDLCPTLEDLLGDPLLCEEWPYLKEGNNPQISSQHGESSSHSTVDLAQYPHQLSKGQASAFQQKKDEKSAEQNRDCSPDEHSSGNSNAPRESDAKGSTPDEEADEEKRMRRIIRNRESASLSRERKKMQMAEKEKQISDLQAKCSSVSVLANRLGQENGMLRQELARMCQQYGQPLPQVVLSCPSMLGPQAMPTAIQPTHNPIPTQKVAIQRMPVSRPAPALACSKANKRPPKQRKQQAIAGGTTIMAALFCFMFFWSPMSPSPRMSVPISHLQIGEDGARGHARILQSAAEEGEEVPSKWIAPQASNQTGNLHIQPTDLDTESRALQHLKDIGAVAVFSKYDTDAGEFSSPAPWKSLASLADSALARDGISKSAQCEKVFSLDISAVENPEAVQKQLQKQMVEASSFKGRYQALTLPPPGQSLPALTLEESSGNANKIRCEDSSSDDYIISVMMPTKEQLEGYTAISKLYIVVLNPNKRYTTYSCGFEKPVLI